MWFVAGFIVGGWNGFSIAALCHVAHESEEKHEKEIQS